MAVATGVGKKVAFKKETTWNVLAGAAGARYLRRVTSDVGLVKDTYESNEIRSDFQRAAFSHGARRVEGTLNGELAPGSYSEFFGSALRRDFDAISDITGLTLTVAAESGTPPTQTITRSAGDWRATGGIKIGMVIRVTAGLAAPSLNRNLFVADITSATVIKVFVLDRSGTPLTTESAVGGCTVNVPGKRTYAPLTGHVNNSYTIEHWFSEINQSEQFTGCRVGSMEVGLPATGIATCNTSFLGGNLVTGTSQYFTTPTAAGTASTLAAVNGVLVAQGALVGLLTGLNFTINDNPSVTPVVGSNYPPDVFAGSIVASGQATVYFQDATFRDYFLNETDVILSAVATTASGASGGTADFVAFSFPRVKFGAATKDDGQTGIVQTMPFQALLAATGGANIAWEQTTMMIQDSQAA